VELEELLFKQEEMQHILAAAAVEQVTLVPVAQDSEEWLQLDTHFLI
jgi:hypothetical protein